MELTTELVFAFFNARFAQFKFKAEPKLPPRHYRTLFTMYQLNTWVQREELKALGCVSWNYVDSTIKELEDKQFITSRLFEATRKKRAAKRYRITATGRERIRELGDHIHREWEIAQAVFAAKKAGKEYRRATILKKLNNQKHEY